MRMLGGLGCAALGLVLVAMFVRPAVGEWVQVPVIGRVPDKTTPPPTISLDHIGAPGPNVDDVITIKRTVGDSFSNKDGVVPVTPELREEPVPVPVSPEGLPLQALREAHQALLEHSSAPISGKLDFLRRLKNRLLKHAASLVPRSVRSLVGGEVQEGRGHKGVGFPSNEGTLMSLAFLVFAVFLVKVVMQLIYAVQNNQNANGNAGVRVAQMQIPGAMAPAGMGTVMGTMMNMMPAAMPPMMAAMDMGAARARRHAQTVDRLAAGVLSAIEKAQARFGHWDPEDQAHAQAHPAAGTTTA